MKYPLPQLNKFIAKHTKGEWQFCERYMTVNGKKIEESLPIDKKLTSGSYKIGVVIHKHGNNNKIIFITYTLFEGKCVVNHESVHDLEGNILAMTTNMFYMGMLRGVDDDSVSYLKQMLAEFDSNNFAWDVVK